MVATKPYPLPPVRPRWRTPDAAIREAVLCSPLRGRGIDYARVPTTGDGTAVARDAISRVLAAVGRFDMRTQQVLIGWALGLSYRQIARLAAAAELEGMSATTCRRLHKEAWPKVRDRLVELGLVEGG